MNEVSISREGAYLLMRLLEEIGDIDRRAGCSDRYFRQHFMSAVRVARVSGALDELHRALAAKEGAPAAHGTQQSIE